MARVKSNQLIGLGRAKKAPPPDSYNWRAGETVYGDWRARGAPKMRRGTPAERAAFAAEIRSKTKLFEGSPK
jgi:hypothetical protein